MRSSLRFPPIAVLIAGAATWLLLTAACTTLHTVQPADLSAPSPPARIWVTRADHSTVVFDEARVSGDSLIGILYGQQPQRLPLSEATVLRVRQPAPGRTAGLVFAGAVGATALVFVLVGDKSCREFGGCNFLRGAGLD